MKKSDFRGTGKVFKFTFIQHYKSKSTIITLVIFLLLSILSIPLYSAVSGKTSLDVDDEIEKIYFNNLSENSFSELDELFGSAEMIPCNDEPKENISMAVYLEVSDGEVPGVLAESLDPDNGFEVELSSLVFSITRQIQRAELEKTGVGKEQLDLIYADVNVNILDADEYLKTEENLDTDSYFLVSYVLSILIMILTLFSSISIIQAVVEEKSSKLIELLLISVEPLALMLGKVLAVMAYMLLEFVLIGLAVSVSSAISGAVMNVSISTILSGNGMGQLLASLNVKDVLIFLVSVILGYSTFALLGGLSGARCRTTEEAGSANLSVMLIVVFSYLAAVVQSGIDSTAFSVITAICPMLSVFCAPASFICGRIGIGVLLLSWLLQAGVVVLLALFTARVYKNLIVYNGSKVNLKMLIRMAKDGEKA